MIKSEETGREVKLEGTGLTILTELAAIVATMRGRGLPEQAINQAVKTGHKAYEKFKNEVNWEA